MRYLLLVLPAFVVGLALQPGAHASRRLHDSPAAPGDDVETLIALLEGRPVITQDAQAAAGAIIFRAIEGQRAAGPWVASAAQAQASTVAVLAGLDLYIQVNGCTEPVIEAIKDALEPYGGISTPLTSALRGLDTPGINVSALGACLGQAIADRN